MKIRLLWALKSSQIGRSCFMTTFFEISWEIKTYLVSTQYLQDSTQSKNIRRYSGWLSLKMHNRWCKEFSLYGFSGGIRDSYRKKRWVVWLADISILRSVQRPCHPHNPERKNIVLQYYNTYSSTLKEQNIPAHWLYCRRKIPEGSIVHSYHRLTWLQQAPPNTMLK